VGATALIENRAVPEGSNQVGKKTPTVKSKTTKEPHQMGGTWERGAICEG